jgi:hypothetical protein
MSSKVLKQELLVVVQEAMEKYMNSVRAREILPQMKQVLVIIVPGTYVVQVQVSTNAGPLFFEASIKQSS